MKNKGGKKLKEEDTIYVYDPVRKQYRRKYKEELRSSHQPADKDGEKGFYSRNISPEKEDLATFKQGHGPSKMDRIRTVLLIILALASMALIVYAVLHSAGEKSLDIELQPSTPLRHNVP